MPLTPQPSDLLGVETTLSEVEQQAIARLRETLEGFRPLIDDHWNRDAFPMEVVAPLAATGVLGHSWEETRAFEASAAYRGWVAFELYRVDASIGTFVAVQNGLAASSIGICGSAEQRAEWLPRLADGSAIGAFGLTEPESGSDAARGLQTTARREGDTWVLDGAKRWIGNATFADVCVIWAKDVADEQVKGFLVPTDTPGFTTSKIERKISLRMVQNADIVLDGVRVPDAMRMPNANSFKDTAKVLRRTRLEVAWSAIGLAAGAYEAALAYTRERVQFGRPIAGHQLVQDLLARSIGAITASISLCSQISRLEDAGTTDDAHSAMAKAYATARMREVVGWCREVCGGNGIVTDHQVARFFADAEGVYTYEGTFQMNQLIVGRAISGFAAFA